MVTEVAPASDLLRERGRSLATASLLPFAVAFVALGWVWLTFASNGREGVDELSLIIAVVIATGSVAIATMLLVGGHVLKTLADAEKLRAGSAPTEE
ncbi:MAG TPA: hypothetical protein VFX15_01500 [Actinomycetes bacterium]|nr:hypothetical protein [Actinomycetes bacterium]